MSSRAGILLLCISLFTALARAQAPLNVCALLDSAKSLENKTVDVRGEFIVTRHGASLTDKKCPSRGMDVIWEAPLRSADDLNKALDAGRDSKNLVIGTFHGRLIRYNKSFEGWALKLSSLDGLSIFKRPKP